MTEILNPGDIFDGNDGQLAETWQTITLQNGWTNRGGAYANASYRRLLSSSWLHIVLNLSAGTTTNGTIVFTLASGYRPLHTVQIPIICRIAAAPQQMSSLEIDSSGNAKCFDLGSTATLHSNGLIPLDL